MKDLKIKKTIMICLLSLFSIALFSDNMTLEKVKPLTDSLNKTQVYNDLKGLYKDDIKGLIKYSFTRIDTIAQNGVRLLSKGVDHTYQVLKTQQLVKSLHHLFYWILGIIIAFVLIRKFKEYMLEPKEELGWLIVILCGMDICLFIYNGTKFMEMWTGFINPEYGVYKDILEITYNQK